MSNFHEKDPIYQQGQRQHEQNFDRTMQRLHKAGELEHLAQQRLSYLLIVYLPRLLWTYSRASVFLFVIPLLLFVFGSMGITAGLSNYNYDISSAIAGFVFGAICFAALSASMWWGYKNKKAIVPLNQIIAKVQIGLVGLYTILAIYRTIQLSGLVSSFDPGNGGNVLSFIMFLLFIAMVISDVRAAKDGKRTME